MFAKSLLRTNWKFADNGLQNQKKKAFFFAAENNPRNPQLKYSHCVENGFDARNFVRAEQVGFAKSGKDGEERLGAADFIAEKFKGMGQGMANGKTKCA